MSEFDPCTRSFEVLGAAQEALADRRPDRDRETWALSVVLLRSPLANGIVKGAEYAYICATVAAAAITDSAAIRRIARTRIVLYGMAFYVFGLGCGVLNEQLPRAWELSQGLMIGISVAQTSIAYVALHLLAASALKLRTPPPSQADDRQHGQEGQHPRRQDDSEHDPNPPQKPRHHD